MFWVLWKHEPGHCLRVCRRTGTLFCLYVASTWLLSLHGVPLVAASQYGTDPSTSCHTWPRPYPVTWHFVSSSVLPADGKIWTITTCCSYITVVITVVVIKECFYFDSVCADQTHLTISWLETEAVLWCFLVNKHMYVTVYSVFVSIKHWVYPDSDKWESNVSPHKTSVKPRFNAVQIMTCSHPCSPAFSLLLQWICLSRAIAAYACLCVTNNNYWSVEVAAERCCALTLSFCICTVQENSPCVSALLCKTCTNTMDLIRSYHFLSIKLITSQSDPDRNCL